MRASPLLVVAALLAAGGAGAQLSPGELARAHAELEGAANCRRCHDPAKGVDPARCLACHQSLATRIGAARGLHARPEYEPCQTCHIDHHGRDFELVWWGDAGVAAFDHREAGWTPTGRHARLGCRDCHQAALVKEPEALRAAGKDLDRTFLGLGTACLDCHQDSHRGELGDACSDCHDPERWRPARFDHDRARYRLDGRHHDVACEKCHPGDDGGVRYRGLAFASCGDCHRDPHAGRLGERCASCHGTAGWTAVRLDGFDHDRTRYPLRGRHRALACEHCHTPARRERDGWRVARFERCTDCHADRHAGQLTDRADGGRCVACHTVDGFAPARYGFDEHQRGAYPLAGAHRAVPCNGCHPRTVATPAGERVARYRTGSTACDTCHRDPHLGDSQPHHGPDGCRACHGPDGWREVRFDHAATGYRLAGAHLRAGCTACHRPTVADGATVVRLTGAPTACDGCHDDAHAHQFDHPGGASDCARCHGTEVWRPARFDHQRDSRYRLDGAHLRVPCLGCHPTQIAGERRFVRYRPLSDRCADCHGTTAPPRRR